MALSDPVPTAGFVLLPLMCPEDVGGVLDLTPPPI